MQICFLATVTATKCRQSHACKVLYFAPQTLIKESKTVPELGEYAPI